MKWILIWAIYGYGSGTAEFDNFGLCNDVKRAMDTRIEPNIRDAGRYIECAPKDVWPPRDDAR